MKQPNDGNHLNKCHRHYDKENRIYYYADELTKLNNMIQAVQAGNVTKTVNGGVEKNKGKQEIKTTLDEDNQ